jgi:hypothetical protein
MQSRKWLIVASALLLAGGLSWLLKIAVIVATDGRVMTTGPAAALMSGGLVLLPLGAAGLGAWLARRTHVAVRVLAAFAAVGTLLACSVVLGMGASALARGREPAYWADEAGILAAGLLWSALGAVALARARQAARPSEGSASSAPT